MSNQNRTFNVAVVGATGAVGETMLKILAERQFPIGTLNVLASQRSAGEATGGVAKKRAWVGSGSGSRPRERLPPSGQVDTPSGLAQVISTSGPDSELPCPASNASWNKAVAGSSGAAPGTTRSTRSWAFSSAISCDTPISCFFKWKIWHDGCAHSSLCQRMRKTLVASRMHGVVVTHHCERNIDVDVSQFLKNGQRSCATLKCLLRCKLDHWSIHDRIRKWDTNLNSICAIGSSSPNRIRHFASGPRSKMRKWGALMRMSLSMPIPLKCLSCVVMHRCPNDPAISGGRQVIVLLPRVPVNINRQPSCRKHPGTNGPGAIWLKILNSIRS